MKLKTLHATLSLLGLSALLCGPVAAEDRSTVTFNGRVEEVTCSIDPGDADQTVHLPVISDKALQVSGTTAGATPFRINVRCPLSVLQVRAYFENSTYTDPDTGNLKLQTEAGKLSAGNVQVRLLRVDGTPIAVGNRLSMPVFPTDSGAAKLEYQAVYYATGEATAGQVYTSATYTIEQP